MDSWRPPRRRTTTDKPSCVTVASALDDPSTIFTYCSTLPPLYYPIASAPNPRTPVAFSHVAAFDTFLSQASDPTCYSQPSFYTTPWQDENPTVPLFPSLPMTALSHTMHSQELTNYLEAIYRTMSTVH